MYLRKVSGIVFTLLLLLPLYASAQNLTTPKAVFEANIEATGGMDAWEEVKTMYMMTEVVMDVQQMSFTLSTESWIIKPNYMLSKAKMLDAPPEMPAGAGNVTVYITPEEGWMDSMQGRMDVSSLPAAQQMQYESTMKAKEELARLAQPDSMFTLLESQELDGAMAYVIEIKGDSGAKLYYDQSSHLLIGTEMPSPMGGGPIIARSLDYETVDGLKVARTIEVDLGAMGSQSMNIRRIEFNGDITPESLASMAE